MHISDDSTGLFLLITIFRLHTGRARSQPHKNQESFLAYINYSFMQFDHVRLEKSWATLFQVTGNPLTIHFFTLKLIFFFAHPCMPLFSFSIFLLRVTKELKEY